MNEIPTLAVIDWNTGTVTVDGEPVPGDILDSIEVESLDGYAAIVHVPLIAQNVLVLHRDGTRSSPTARDAALRIVREGLADVLRWLSPEDLPGPQEEDAAMVVHLAVPPRSTLPPDGSEWMKRVMNAVGNHLTRRLRHDGMLSAEERVHLEVRPASQVTRGPFD